MKIRFFLTLLVVFFDKTVLGSFNITENEVDSYGSNKYTPKLPASHIKDEVDILKLINVTSKDQGVSLVEGPIKNFNAYKFRLPYGNVPLANSSNVTKALSSSTGFTVIFLYRQQKNNLGTLISVNSPGRIIPWFQLSSNMKTGTLSLKYKVNLGDKLRQIDWILPVHHRKAPMAAWIWLSVSVDFSTGTIRLDLDCQPSRFESLTRADGAKITLPDDAIVYFRQEPGRKKKFLGSMQVAKILPYVSKERMWSCMRITESASRQHRKPLLL
ncbi:kielin/chordin-like protein [Onthophagus taurus]|uniref:kielin/chordin-like protein n=1 Tax=Onthophagus taurus TaxID=166361 RepID=UPI000C209E0D|nr:kielin/chordin-like protein [Onthophagus taurus]XP_022899941.1 kielin/chordin-like protein [Onthophagus taurus]